MVPNNVGAPGAQALVPKLHLGTPFGARVHLARRGCPRAGRGTGTHPQTPPPARRTLAPRCVPKWNLGTRRKIGSYSHCRGGLSLRPLRGRILLSCPNSIWARHLERESISHGGGVRESEGGPEPTHRHPRLRDGTDRREIAPHAFSKHN